VVLRGIVRAFLLALALALVAHSAALSADPTPSPAPVVSPVLIDPLDPRAGGGANSSGAPLLALVVVIGAGVVAAGVTYAYARATRQR
jgi:hypothetical protein